MGSFASLGVVALLGLICLPYVLLVITGNLGEKSRNRR
jgi:hypothetical protein